MSRIGNEAFLLLDILYHGKYCPPGEKQTEKQYKDKGRKPYPAGQDEHSAGSGVFTCIIEKYDKLPAIICIGDLIHIHGVPESFIGVGKVLSFKQGF